jgi:diguanylate cyclase (GGDEF)-like protein/PAS domain S-box-containing protein
MLIRNVDYAILSLVIALIYLAVGLYSWNRRDVSGAAALAVLMFGAGAYAVPYILGLASANLPQALFWYHISLPGASILGPAWIVFALQYSRQDEILNGRRCLLIGLIPLVCCIAAWTNSLHGLYGSDFRFDPSSAWPVLEWKFGIFYWINFGYAYLTTALGMVLLARMAIKRWRPFTRQTVLLLAGAIIPTILNVGFVLGFTPIPHLDTAPFCFLITGITWSLAIFRYRFLDIVPVARDRVFETMPVGVIVLDLQDRVLDINPAALKILGLSLTKVLGDKLAPIFQIIEPGDRPIPLDGMNKEITLAKDQLYLHLHLTPLMNRRKKQTGSLLLVQDVTQAKLAEMAEQKQRLLVETMRRAVDNLTHTLDPEELLDLVLVKMGMIVPYSAAFIFILDKTGQEARFVRHHFPNAAPATMGENFADLAENQACFMQLLPDMQEHYQSFHLAEEAIALVCASCAAFCHVRDSLGRFVVAPIRVYGGLIGFAVLANTIATPLSSEILDQLDSFISQAGIALENARLYAELSEQAIRDELTGALNRRGFLARAQRELERAHKAQHPCALILIDLDQFKLVNDQFGHAAGDQVLRTIARKCFASIREADIFGRYGGDEFIIFLPDCTLQTAEGICERLRGFAAATSIRTTDGQVSVTLSLGIAVDDSGKSNLEDLFLCADQALYIAKNAGRNCIRSSSAL